MININLERELAVRSARPSISRADALRMSAHDIVDGHLIVTQEKTKQPLRISITGELAALLERIEPGKKTPRI